MRILVCFKAVPNWEKVLESDWERFSPDIDISYAGTAFNCFDESALETALRLKSQAVSLPLLGGGAEGRGGCIPPSCLAAVTVGKTPSAPLAESLYAAGFDEVTVLSDECPEFDPGRVAARLAEFAENGRFDLILTGTQAGMADTGLVPFFLAERLSLPIISGVGDIELSEISCPAVISVGNSPALLRAVSLRARLQAKGRAPEILDGGIENHAYSSQIFTKMDTDRKCAFFDTKDPETAAKQLLSEHLICTETSPKRINIQKEPENVPGLTLLPDTHYGKTRLAKLVLQTGCSYFSGAEIMSIDDNGVTVRKNACASNQLWTARLSFPAAVTTPVQASGGAQTVIICGTGVGSKEICEKARVVAEKLGAGFGLTRPAALCGWGSPEEIVGQSGSRVSPETCLVLGASGAGAFLAGIEGAGRIIAVNTDPHALIFRHADMGLVADAPELIGALLAEVEMQ